MDKYTKSVYKFLLSQPGYGFLTDMATPEGFNIFEFRKACEYLVRLGYAKKVKCGYVLLHEGIHKRELDQIEFRKKFFTRYLPGFISGIASGVAIALLVHFLLS